MAGFTHTRSERRQVILKETAREFEVSLDHFRLRSNRLVVLNFFVVNGEILERAPRNKPFWMALDKLKVSTGPGYFAQVQVVVESGEDAASAGRAALGFLSEADHYIFRHF
jgi:hypothetical protein